MAIPLTWRKTLIRYRYSSSNGWEEVQTWKGRAGAAMVEFNEFLANFSGYTSLEVQHIMPLDPDQASENYDAEMQVELGFGVTGPDGTKLGEGDPEFGLVSRKWTKDSNRIPVSLLAHPRVEVLHTVDPEWPDRIRLQAIAYAQTMRQLARGEIDWTPDREQFRDDAQPDDWVTTPGGEAAAIEDWLFREFSVDEDASYEVANPILRKVETVINSSRLAAVHANVGRFHTYAALQAVESSLSAAAIVAAADLSALYWLKGDPVVDDSTAGRFEIVQEWEGWRYLSPNTIMRYGAVIT
jgi:hypothetical protein